MLQVKKQRILAMTLVEVLIVITISTMSFFGFIEYTRNISFARLATNAAQASVNLARTTKHQAMLLRRNPNDPWIFGTGLKIYKDTDHWVISRFRYIDTSGAFTDALYHPYPRNIPPKPGQIEEFETSTTYTLRDRLIMEPRVIIHVFKQFNGSNRELHCNSYYVIFESLKGIVHFYCQPENSSLIQQINDIDMFLVGFEPSQSVLEITNLGDIFLLPKQNVNIDYGNN